MTIAARPSAGQGVPRRSGTGLGLPGANVKVGQPPARLGDRPKVGQEGNSSWPIATTRKAGFHTLFGRRSNDFPFIRVAGHTAHTHNGSDNHRNRKLG